MDPKTIRDTVPLVSTPWDIEESRHIRRMLHEHNQALANTPHDDPRPFDGFTQVVVEDLYYSDLTQKDVD